MARSFGGRQHTAQADSQTWFARQPNVTGLNAPRTPSFLRCSSLYEPLRPLR